MKYLVFYAPYDRIDLEVMKKSRIFSTFEKALEFACYLYEKEENLKEYWDNFSQDKKDFYENDYQTYLMKETEDIEEWNSMWFLEYKDDDSFEG